MKQQMGRMLQLQMLAVGMQEFHKLVNPKTKLISLVHVSNTLGTILPTQEVVEAAQKVKHMWAVCLLFHVSQALQCLATCLSVLVTVVTEAPVPRCHCLQHTENYLAYVCMCVSTLTVYNDKVSTDADMQVVPCQLPSTIQRQLKDYSV